MTIESAASYLGFDLDKFKAKLDLPMTNPSRPRHLHVIDGNFLDKTAVDEFRARSVARQHQQEIIPDENMERILANYHHNGEHQRAAILATSYFAGLRVGEIATLTMDKVIEADGTLKEISHLERHLTKTKKNRAFYLVDPVARKYLGYWVKMRLDQDAQPHDPVFTKKSGGPYSPNYLAKYIKRMYISHDLPRCASHSGRAATATRYLQSGHSLKFTGKILGHTNTSTTAIYDRVSDNDVVAKMKALRNGKAQESTT